MPRLDRGATEDQPSIEPVDADADAAAAPTFARFAAASARAAIPTMGSVARPGAARGNTASRAAAASTSMTEAAWCAIGTRSHLIIQKAVLPEDTERPLATASRRAIDTGQTIAAVGTRGR
jgi:hypothetical protein